MARRPAALPLLAALVLAAGLRGSGAVLCPPGHGIHKGGDLLSMLGNLLGGRPTAAAPASCTQCGQLEASAGGENAECVLCVPLLSAPNADSTACDCLPGTYVGSAAAPSSSVRRTCVQCAAGAVSTTRNAASCTPCPAGAKVVDNKCACATGFVATGLGPLGVTGCRQCAPGQVSPGGLATECSACGEATPPLADASACGCRPGFRLNTSEPLTCVPCESALQFTPKSNRNWSCQQCPQFSYATADSTACVCGGGYYALSVSSEAGAQRCEPCPAGTFKAAAGNGDVSSCIQCPAGLEPSGSRKQCVPARCPAGMQQVAAATADGQPARCELCPEGTYNMKRGGTCKPCLDQTVPNPERTKCDMCATGALQTSKTGEDLRCNACMFHWVMDEKLGRCVEDTSVPEEHRAQPAP